MDDLFEHVMRVHPEPYEYVDDRTVHGLLTADPADYVNHVHTVLMRIAAAKALVDQPPKRIFTDPDTRGDFRVMPCVVRDGPDVVKTVKIVGTNVIGRKVPDQITVGRAFRLDPDENFVTHIFEACLLSSARTGACVTMAIRMLADRRRRVTIVGAGRVGCYAAIYAAGLKGVQEIVFRDADWARAATTAEAVQQMVGPAVHCYADFDPHVPDADVLVVATTSQNPLFGPEDISASLIVSVGADIETQRELTTDWPRVADVYTDTAESVHVGDLRAWIAEGAITREDVTDLNRLFKHGPRQTERRCRIFISTGSALFDNITVGYLFRQLNSMKSELVKLGVNKRSRTSQITL